MDPVSIAALIVALIALIYASLLAVLSFSYAYLLNRKLRRLLLGG